MPNRVLEIPISPFTWLELRGDFPITEEEWGLMIAILDAFKPGLVEVDKPDADG